MGSTYSWQGERLGEGRLVNVRLVPYSRIEQELVFRKGAQEVKAANYWILKDLSDGKTQVTWSFRGVGRGF